MLDNLLLNLDFFGDPIAFTYRGKNSFQSKLGGIITVIISVLAITLIYGLGQNFFGRKNPKFSKEDVSEKNTPIYNVNNLNFSLAFKIEDELGYKISNKKIYLKITEEKTVRTNEEDSEYSEMPSVKIEMKNCTEDLFPDKELFISKNLNLYQCPILNHTIGGSYSERMMSYLYLSVNICKDGGKNDNDEDCDDESETLELLKQGGIYLTTYVQSPIIQSSNYYSGIKYNLKMDYISLSFFIQKVIYFKFKTTEMITNFGWFIEEKTRESVLGFNDRDFDQIFSNDTQTEEIAWVLIQLEKDTIRYNREYETISSLAANVGGILKIFLVFGAIFASFYNKIKFKSQISKYIFELYHFNDKESKLNHDCVHFKLKPNQNSNSNSTILIPNQNKILNADISKSHNPLDKRFNSEKVVAQLSNNVNDDKLRIGSFSAYNSQPISDSVISHNKSIINEISSENRSDFSSLKIIPKQPKILKEERKYIEHSLEHPEYLKDYNDALPVNEYLIFTVFFCCKSKKINLKKYDKMLDFIDYKLDITEYLLHSYLNKDMYYNLEEGKCNHDHNPHIAKLEQSIKNQIYSELLLKQIKN